MCRMTHGSGLKTADRREANYKLLCSSLDFPWITATELAHQRQLPPPPTRPIATLESKIKWPQHMEAAKQWFIFMTFDECFLI